MRKMMLAISVCCLAVTVCMGAAPVADFPPGLPGLRVDFVADVYPGPGEGEHGYVKMT